MRQTMRVNPDETYCYKTAENGRRSAQDGGEGPGIYLDVVLRACQCGDPEEEGANTQFIILPTAPLIVRYPPLGSSDLGAENLGSVSKRLP